MKWGLRIGFIGLLVMAILIAVLNTCKNEKEEPIDNNVYLNEEVVYAKEVHMKVISLNVSTNDSSEPKYDDDNDLLSQYTLNMGVLVEQITNDSKEDKVKVAPSNFKLKSVNLKAKSNMAVFVECLAKETLSVLVSGAVSGSVNILEETINFAGEYTLANIENAENSKTDFKPIKCKSDCFEPFYPRDYNESIIINISFPIKQEYLESENVIVLAIDSWNHIERRIFLITRPQLS